MGEPSRLHSFGYAGERGGTDDTPGFPGALRRGREDFADPPKPAARAVHGDRRGAMRPSSKHAPALGGRGAPAG